jgi:CDP-diacylglycerol--glycerol-3-phosphate 3-phosphatidyltransferase
VPTTGLAGPPLRGPVYLKHIPNLLSLARLLAAPYLFWLLWERAWWAAALVMVLAAITDGLDGFLARRWKTSSQAGEVLDPIADKVLLSGSFLTLALNGSIAPWLAVLVLGRDALILLAAAGALLLSKTVRRFPPSIWGKASTVAQIAFIVALVTHGAGWAPAGLVELGKWIVAALTLWSGIDYAFRAMRLKPAH